MKYIAALISLLLLPTHAQASEVWLSVGESETAKFSIKVSTLDFATNKAGESVVTAIGRTENSDKTIDVYKLYVSFTDCDAGYGKLVTLETDGTFQFENDFAEGSGNIGSSKAEALCFFYKKAKERAQKKSL